MGVGWKQWETDARGPASFFTSLSDDSVSVTYEFRTLIRLSDPLCIVYIIAPLVTALALNKCVD